MLILDIYRGKVKITKFQAEVSEGNALWDDGWRVGVKKIGPFKFLVWTKDDINDYKYSVDDVAKRFRVTHETVRRWCRTNKIKFLKLPGVKGKFLFSNEDLKNFEKHAN